MNLIDKNPINEPQKSCTKNQYPPNNSSGYRNNPHPIIACFMCSFKLYRWETWPAYPNWSLYMFR